MRVIIAGSRWLGAEVLSLCQIMAVDIVGVAVPDMTDRLGVDARVAGVDVVRHKDLETFAGILRPDIILAAHCQGYITKATRDYARLGCLAYHPSLLPRHRGRDAVEWTIRFKDAVAGGTLYWMDDTADTGPITLQRWVHVHPNDDAGALWRRDLGPLGVLLFKEALTTLQAGLSLPSVTQSEPAATWEPAINQKPLSKAPP